MVELVLFLLFMMKHIYIGEHCGKQERNEQVDIKEFILPVREVHIEPPQRQPMKHIRKLFTFLNEEETHEE